MEPRLHDYGSVWKCDIGTDNDLLGINKSDASLLCFSAFFIRKLNFFCILCGKNKLFSFLCQENYLYNHKIQSHESNKITALRPAAAWSGLQ